MLLLLFQFEEAARDAADELTQPRPLGEEAVEDIQVLLHSDANPVQIRKLRVRLSYTHTHAIVCFLLIVNIFFTLN